MRLNPTSVAVPEFVPLLTDDQLKQWRDAIDKASRIVICTHKSPDGDALGSSLALQHCLLTLGKPSDIVIPDS